MLRKLKKDYINVICLINPDGHDYHIKFPLSHILFLKNVARKENVSFKTAFIEILKMGIQSEDILLNERC